MPTVNSILVLDCPGFQNPASCGQLQDGASFNDLCHNYFHERLQLLFHQTNIDNPREHYAQVILVPVYESFHFIRAISVIMAQSGNKYVG